MQSTTFKFSANELFSVGALLTDTAQRVSKSKDGDTCAYRISRNLAYLNPILDTLRKTFLSEVERQVKEAGLDPASTDPDTIAKTDEIRRSVADIYGAETEEVTLRLLPPDGIAWSEVPQANRVALIQVGLIADSDVETVIPKAGQP